MSESLRKRRPRSGFWRPAIGEPRRYSRVRARLLSLSGCIRAYGNLSPRDTSSRAAKRVCDEGRGVGPSGLGVYLDLADAIPQARGRTLRERYGNLLEMYQALTGEDHLSRAAASIRCTAMGGLWSTTLMKATRPACS